MVKTETSQSARNGALKGLVLAGGKGSRLRPLTATGAKQLVPVANKPVLFYALQQMVEAGITDIGIVTGDTAAQVEEALGDGSDFGATFTFIRQEAPLGLAHAIATGREFLGDAAFCMYLGDNFLRCGIAKHVERYRQSGACAQILLKQVDDPSALGVAVLDDEGRVRHLVEKPQVPVSNLAVIGVYFFGPEIHEITPTLKPSARGELEITDAIQGLIDAGHMVESSVFDDVWIDTGKKDDMLEANRVVLSTIQRRIDGHVDGNSSVVGEVVVDAGARIVNSSVRGPVVIGAGARIENAFIGPFTAIGDRCEILDCEIEHSIVMCDSAVRNIHLRISDSLIGKEVVVERRDDMPRTVKLLLGDHAQVGLI
ncbi:MAG TPA: glucose-1-phosphate thymidylyltransferase [Thermomicrobiales bacterium]|nr:glucose-1-phosphate thymidylyltransferase [Thermomicrobiales bacterium]